jgi:hypothetical protein
MLRLLKTPLLIIGLVVGLSLSTVLIKPLSSPAAAVDIFNRCTSSLGATAPNNAACADCTSPVGKTTNYCKDVAAQNGTNPVVKIIKTVINIVSYIGGAAAIIALIVSALRMILSNGDANSVTAARNGILYSLIGIGVIVLAQAIVVFVLDKVK